MKLIDHSSEFLSHLNLTDDDRGRIEAEIEAATSAMHRYCNRKFMRSNYDEIVSVGQFGSGIVNNFPIASLSRICDRQAGVLQVWITDESTTATANVGRKSLTLHKITSGITDDTALDWATYPTLQDLADAIDDLDGWAASVITGFQNYPSSDLVAHEFINCIQGGNLYAWLDATGEWVCEYDQGIIDGFTPYQSVRICYVAGYTFDQVPADLQRVCAEMVSNMFDPKQGQVVSETVGGYSYTLAQGEAALARLPISSKRILERYKVRRF